MIQPTEGNLPKLDEEMMDVCKKAELQSDWTTPGLTGEERKRFLELLCKSLII